MAKHILITGAAGYIGGSILTDFLNRESGLIKEAKISAAVRSEEQVKVLSQLGINLIQVDLNDATATVDAVIRNKVDIVLHLANAMDYRPATHLIRGLGERRKVTAEETFFVHSSVMGIYIPEYNWPHGEAKDSDPLLHEKEKKIPSPNPVQQAHILITREAKNQNVTSLIVPIPVVYGRGTGAYRKESTPFPSLIRASIKLKTVYKFDKEGVTAAAHVSDIVALFALITEKILRKEPIPNGENGYFFAMAHRLSWWAVPEQVAQRLYARGLVSEPQAKIWPSDDMAAESLGWPPQFVRAMATHVGNFTPENAYRLGWQPQWDERKMLDSIDDEIIATQAGSGISPSIYASLTPK